MDNLYIYKSSSSMNLLIIITILHKNINNGIKWYKRTLNKSIEYSDKLISYNLE